MSVNTIKSTNVYGTLKNKSLYDSAGTTLIEAANTILDGTLEVGNLRIDGNYIINKAIYDSSNVANLFAFSQDSTGNTIINAQYGKDIKFNMNGGYTSMWMDHTYGELRCNNGIICYAEVVANALRTANTVWSGNIVNTGNITSATGYFSSSLSINGPLNVIGNITNSYGNLTSTNGTFSGTISSVNNTTSGTATIGTITNTGSLTSTNGTFSGNISANNCTFSGNVSANNISANSGYEVSSDKFKPTNGSSNTLSYIGGSYTYQLTTPYTLTSGISTYTLLDGSTNTIRFGTGYNPYGTYMIIVQYSLSSSCGGGDTTTLIDHYINLRFYRSTFSLNDYYFDQRGQDNIVTTTTGSVNLITNQVYGIINIFEDGYLISNITVNYSKTGTGYIGVATSNGSNTKIIISRIG